MNTFLIVATAVQFLGLVALAIVLRAKSKKMGETSNALSECQSNLHSFSGIDDADKHLEACKEKARDAILELERTQALQQHECSSYEQQIDEKKKTSQEYIGQIEELKEKKAKLETLIRQYRSAVGDFKSVAALKSRISELQQVVGTYETAAQLQARIEEQKVELRQCAEALQVAPNANEILSKVKYYDNLVQELAAEVEAIEETRDLQHFGLYRPQYSFEHSAEYKAALDEVVEQRKRMIKGRQAVEVPPGITVAGDERAGQKLGEEYAKVMLRAFNGEADADILKAKYNNMDMLQKRMRRSREHINKLGQTMQIFISEAYLELRLQELRLAYEWERKKQQEREEQAFLKEQAREEEKARREAEKAEKAAALEEKKEQERLEEKEQMLAELRREFETRKLDLEGHVALSKEEQDRLRAQLQEQENAITNLESQRETLITAVKEAHEKRQAAISLAQLTKRGHVYVLSNIGSFGDKWFKIGMTRREDPSVRVKELASASVPFPFDIHAMILTNDAPALENKLHAYFADRRVNKVNARKEFFEVTFDEIRAAVEEIYSSPIQFRQVIPEAAEYRETEAIRRSSRAGEEVPRAIKERLRTPSSL